MAILSEYGEYPAEYRPLIWKSLLKLPNNTVAYCKLLEKGTHKCVKSFVSGRVSDPILRKNLKKIISLLAHWSQILGISFHSEEHFLPYFVFPFVKFASSDMLMCFELIATILINQCCLWFEFSPLLPSNYLGVIENLIDHFEPTLAQFYRQHSVTSSIYAWKVMRTAFSEVLAEFQWYFLWDHIISAPSYFFVFVIVAFNSVQRSTIKRLKNPQEIQTFFDEPCSINMRAWLRKAYNLMEKCPKDLHPNQYMENCNLLGVDDQYQKILNYPSDALKMRSKQLEQMEERVRSINQRYMEIEKFEMNLMQQMVNNAQAEEHRKRMQNVDLVHEMAFVDAAKCIENQRQHLILSERQLNNREALMKMIQMDDQFRHKIDEHEIQMQKFSCELQRMVRVVFLL